MTRRVKTVIAALAVCLSAVQASAAIYRATSVGTVLGLSSTLGGQSIADATPLIIDALFDSDTDSTPAAANGHFAALSARLTLAGQEYDARIADLTLVLFRFAAYTGAGFTNAAGNRGFVDYFSDPRAGFDVNWPTAFSFTAPASRNNSWPFVIPTTQSGDLVLTGYTPGSVAIAAIGAPVPVPGAGPLALGALCGLVLITRRRRS